MSKKTKFGAKTNISTNFDTGKTLRAMEAKGTDKRDYLPISKLKPNPMNDKYEQGNIEQLAESIKYCGLVDNIYVISDNEDPGMYRIIAGERRYRAILTFSEEEYNRLFPAGIPCKIEDRELDKVDEEIRLIETNYQKDRGTTDTVALRRWEIKRLLELYSLKNIKLEHYEIRQQVAEKLNISNRQVAKYESADKLIPELDNLFMQKEFTLNQASKFGNLPEDVQKSIYEIIIQNGQISDQEINSLKEEAHRKNTLITELTKQLEDTKQILAQKNAQIIKLNSKHSIKNSQKISEEKEQLEKEKKDIEDTYNRIKKTLNNTKSKVPDNISEEELFRLKKVKAITKALNSIESAYETLNQSKDILLTEEKYKSKFLEIQRKIASVLNQES